MRAALAVNVDVTHFSLWRGGLWLTTGVASVSLALWFFARADPPWVWAMALAPWMLLVSLFSTLKPYRLAWDGVTWQVAARVRPGSAFSPGQGAHVSVAVDLGTWMLLRWRPTLPERRRRSAWLPLQRRGLEPQWHALRCAVYSAAPAPGPDAAADP